MSLDQIVYTARNIKQNRSLYTTALKTAEETGELAQAVLKGHSYEDILGEVADVIIIATDTGYQASLLSGTHESFESDLNMMIDKKLGKWVKVYSDKE